MWLKLYISMENCCIFFRNIALLNLKSDGNFSMLTLSYISTVLALFYSTLCSCVIGIYKHSAAPRAVLNFLFLVCKFSLSKPLKWMHFNYHVKIVKFHQKKWLTILCWLVLPSKLSFQSSLRFKIINFYTRPPSCHAIKISCTLISHGRALSSSKRNSRGTIQPIRTLVYENWTLTASQLKDNS